MLMKSKKKRVLPGFGLSLGFTTLYISLLVLIPLSMVFIETSKLGWGEFIEIVTSERVLHSYKISFGTAIAAAAINAVFGFIVAWVLVRYSFPGKRILDALIDLPFALPTAVAGITLTTLYSTNGWIGQFLEPLNIKIAFTPLGITIALTFIGLPFIVRMVQPVLQDIEKEVEEAAESLGASRFQVFRKVIFPEVFPALLSGFSLAFARGLGEYGSVVFIAGNMPMKTEIAPLMIMTKLEQFDYAGATCLFTLFGILFYISDILEKDYNIDGVLKGAILAIPLLFMTITSYLTGSKIGKKMKKMKSLIVFGLILMTISFASLVFFKSLIPFFSVLVISSIGTGLALPCINSFITGSVSSDKRGFVTSLYGSVRFLGVAIGPPVYSTLMDWSRTGMFLTTAGLTLLVSLLCMILIRVGKKEASKEKNQKKDTLFDKLQLT